jgi:hypothetical protein
MQNQEKPMQQLDLQTLDRQYFWVERPKIVISELKKHFKNVEDVTYLNDGTPSVLVNDEYLVFLPNSIRGHEEETNEYLVCRNDDYGMLENNFTTHDTLERVVDQLLDLESKEIKTSEDLELHLKQCILELKSFGDSQDHSKAEGMQFALDLFKNVHKSYVKEVNHRMAMIMDDLVVIRQELSEERLNCRTGHADELQSHFTNISVACDLDSDESLSWKLYSKGGKN